jgi:hypothetical protein
MRVGYGWPKVRALSRAHSALCIREHSVARAYNYNESVQRFQAWLRLQVFSTVEDQSDETAHEVLGEIVGIAALQDYLLVVFQKEIQLWSARQVLAPFECRQYDGLVGLKTQC